MDLCVGAHVLTCAKVYLWKSEDNFWESLFFFHYVSPWVPNSGSQPGAKCLYLLRQLVGPQKHLLHATRAWSFQGTLPIYNRPQRIFIFFVAW